jgi:hypothetical protein
LQHVSDVVAQGYRVGDRNVQRPFQAFNDRFRYVFPLIDIGFGAADLVWLNGE